VSQKIDERIVTATDHRTPILLPIPHGQRPRCEEPPTRAEILRALPCSGPAMSSLSAASRDEIEIAVEKLADKVDPPRFFPLVGPAQLHHCHWKCTIYYTEQLPREGQRRRAEVVYIDRDHLHLCDTDMKGVQELRP
jgi:hypothetical protein